MIMIKKGGDDTVVVGETWCSETEGMLSECENDDSECENDDSECELLPLLANKKCSSTSGHTLQSIIIIIGKSLNPN